MRKRIQAIICVALVLASGLISGYLGYRTIALLDPAEQMPDYCATYLGETCDETLLGDSSWLLGIPIGAWGTVFAAAYLTLLLLAEIHRGAFAQKAIFAAFLLSGLATAAGVYLSTSFFTGAIPLCPLCLTVHALNLTLCGVTGLLDGRNGREMFADIKNTIGWLLGAESNDNAAGWHATAFIIPACVAIIAYQFIFTEVERMNVRINANQDPAVLVANHFNNKEVELDVSPEDPRLGEEGAPIEIVIFSDFECPACSSLAADVAHMRDHYGDDLTIVFKNFPLDNACNPTLDYDFHPGACLAARAGEIAHDHGLFWEFHDALFAQDAELSPGVVRAVLSDIGLDLSREDLNDEAAGQRVRADVAVGVAVGVRGTPTLFVNNREWTSGGAKELEVFMHELLTTQ